MKFFKNSYVRREKVEDLIEMAAKEHEYYHLEAYHNVRWLSLNDCVQRFTDLRWLSLNDCVQRFTDLLPEIIQYFNEESQNASIRSSER